MSPCMLYPDTIDHVEPDNIPLQQTTGNHQDRPVQTVKPGSDMRVLVVCYLITY